MRLGINVQVLGGHHLSFVKQVMYAMKKVRQFPRNVVPADLYVKREPQQMIRQVYLEYLPRLALLVVSVLRELLLILHLHGYQVMSLLPLLLNLAKKGIIVLQILQLHWVVVNV